jgi:glutamyl-tRNA reductase
MRSMIGVVGLSHKTAPIDVRERLALPHDVVPRVLEDLARLPAVSEVMLISTCNRVEVVLAPDSESTVQAATRAVSRALDSRAPGVSQHLYVHEGTPAVRHLFRVAASLESLVLGEPQILGQVKNALVCARTTGTVGGRLERVVSRAIRAAKRVRTETSIGTGLVSVPSVAVDLARQIFGGLQGRSAVLIGSGEMAESVARLLRSDGTRILVVGRNEHRVAEIARATDGEPRTWNDLESSLVEADVVITSTSAPAPIIGRDLVAGLRRRRRGRRLFFIDLAVPRDVEPAIDELDWVFSYNIDDFSRVVAESLSVREREALEAQRLVDLEVQSFERWADAEQVTPVLVALRTRIRAILELELERSLSGRLKHLGDAERDNLRTMLEAATKKLMHTPTLRLREVAADRDAESYRSELLADAVAELFELEPLSDRPSRNSSAEPGPREEAAATSPRGGDDPSGDRRRDLTGVG